MEDKSEDVAITIIIADLHAKFQVVDHNNFYS